MKDKVPTEEQDSKIVPKNNNQPSQSITHFLHVPVRRRKARAERAERAERVANATRAANRMMSGSPDHGLWQRRGWLIMMRMRHRRSLARPEGWLARFRPRIGRPRKVQYARATLASKTANMSHENVLGDLNTSGVELEAGKSNWNFVRAVVMMVEMGEEGLFRHVITYL